VDGHTGKRHLPWLHPLKEGKTSTLRGERRRRRPKGRHKIEEDVRPPILSILHPVPSLPSQAKTQGYTDTSEKKGVKSEVK